MMKLSGAMFLILLASANAAASEDLKALFAKASIPSATDLQAGSRETWFCSSHWITSASDARGVATSGQVYFNFESVGSGYANTAGYPVKSFAVDQARGALTGSGQTF